MYSFESLKHVYFTVINLVSYSDIMIFTFIHLADVFFQSDLQMKKYKQIFLDNDTILLLRDYRTLISSALNTFEMNWNDGYAPSLLTRHQDLTTLMNEFQILKATLQNKVFPKDWRVL